jgi:hypothetical protein
MRDEIMLPADVVSALATLEPVDLCLSGVPRPHFLRRATLSEDGRRLVGTIVISGGYTAVEDRHGRVNAAESLHAVWNAAHLISSSLGGEQLRATRIIVTPGRRPVPSDKELIIVAQLSELTGQGRDAHGQFLAEILSPEGRRFVSVEVEFWARRVKGPTIPS